MHHKLYTHSRFNLVLILSILFLMIPLGCQGDNPVDGGDTSSSSETDESSSLEELSSLDELSSFQDISSHEGRSSTERPSSSEEISGTSSSLVENSSSSESDSTNQSSSHTSSESNTSSTGSSSSDGEPVSSEGNHSSSNLSSSSVADSLSSQDPMSSSSMQESSSSSAKDFDPDNPLKEFFESNSLPPSISAITLYKNDSKAEGYLEKIIPYAVNTELWSDSLYKKRHFYVPDGQSMSLNSGTNKFSYPNGVVFIKDFYLREYLDENAADPDSGLRLLETRFTFKKNGDWQFITYRWNDDETEAFPLPDGEFVQDLTFWNSQNSGAHQLSHTFPSQRQCIHCHVGNNEVLGFIPPQVNRDNQIQNFISQNKIQGSVSHDLHTWASIHDINAGIQHRSRSYLAANCSHCHSPNGKNQGATFSAVNFTYNSFDQPIIYDTLQSNIPGEDYSRVLFTQRPERSAIIHRMEERNDEDVQMPPLGTHKKDIAAIDLIKDWIDSLPDNWDSLGQQDTIPWNPNSVSIVQAFGGLRVDGVLALHQIPGTNEYLAISRHLGVVYRVYQSNSGWTSEVIHDVGELQTEVEEGLLGLCLHPDYVQNGLYYINYQPLSLNGDVRLEERRLNLNTRQDDGHSRIIIETELRSDNWNHNGGAIAFGRDGYLYVSYGDGGGVGPNNSRGIEYLSGTIIRIDVDNPSNGREYGIPADNPYLGTNRMDEVFVIGLRNAWRFSFSKINGDMYIGDVGDDSPSREEISHIAYDANFTQGYNFGWPCREGNEIIAEWASNCDNATAPIYTYDQYGGAVIGGHVLNRPGNPYHGAYIFVEYGNNARVMGLKQHNGQWEQTVIANAPDYQILDISTNLEGSEIYLQYLEGQINRLELESLE